MGWKDIAHGVLNVAGFIPGVGAIADLANGAIYLSEGKYGEAALCAVAAIPGIGDSVALVSKGAKAAKALKGLSAAKKGAAVVKGLAGAGKNLLKSGIKSGKEILKLAKNIKFNKDFLKTSSKFLSSIPVVGDYFKLGKGVLKGLKSLKGLSPGEILSLLKGKGMKAWGKVKDGARSLKGKSPKELFNAFKNKCKEFFLFGKCFTEDTLVCTESGYLPMKEIKAGDAVYSRNEKTGETGFKRVEQVMKTKAHTLYTIELNGKTEITATAYHPFYIEERGWVNAINLREGDQLSVPEGNALVTLIKKDRYEEPVTMYNFHVEDWVSYYVTELKVYVHNGKKCKGASEAEVKLPPLENGPYIKNGKPNGRPGPTGKKKLEFEQKIYDEQVSPDGILRDPNTDEVIDWKPGQSRKNVADFGHTEGNSYQKKFEQYKNREITLDELKEFQSNPKNFQIETPSSNRSHQYE